MLTATKIRVWQASLLIVLLSAWQFSVKMGWVDPFFFPAPSMIVEKVFQWLKRPEIYSDFGITLLETILGFIFGTILGVSAGISLGLRPSLSKVLEPFIKVLNAIPRVILAPLFILWFGLGIGSKVALGVTLVFFITFFNTYQGVTEVDRTVLNNVRLLGATSRQLLKHVYLPSSATWILSSLRVSVAFALIGAIVGEYMGSSSGLGHLIAQAQGMFDSTGVFAGIFLLAAFALLLDRVLDIAERRLIRWRPSQTASSPQ